MQAALRRKLVRAGGIAGALVLLAGGGLVGSNAWVEHAANGRVYASATSAPARSFAIVPGARVVGGQPFEHLRGRLETALMLYRGGRVKKILVSGNETAASPEASVMSTWLRERGVAAADILVDTGGSRTRETMERAAGVFDITDAVICTQDVGASRSVYLAKQAGIDAVAVSVPSTLWESARFMRNEALKTALAVVESYVRKAPQAPAAARAQSVAMAVR